MNTDHFEEIDNILKMLRIYNHNATFEGKQELIDAELDALRQHIEGLKERYSNDK